MDGLSGALGTDDFLGVEVEEEGPRLLGLDAYGFCVPGDPMSLCVPYVAVRLWLDCDVLVLLELRFCCCCCVSFVGDEEKEDMMPSAVDCAEIPMLQTASILVRCVCVCVYACLCS
jgi:hypothetical protein